MAKTANLASDRVSRLQWAFQISPGQAHDLAARITHALIRGSERSSASRARAGSTANIAGYNSELQQRARILTVFGVAQELGLIFPPWPSEPSEASNIIPISTTAQVSARNTLQRYVEDDWSLIPATFEQRHCIASHMSQLFGTGSPELQRMRRHLEDRARTYFEAQEDGITFADADWNLPGPPDESGTRLTVTSILSNLGRRTHHAIFVSIGSLCYGIR